MTGIKISKDVRGCLVIEASKVANNKIVTNDLVNIVKEIRENEYVLGQDIGVISYNDTPLKDLLGITVMSTDFKTMGATAANMILNREKGKIKNPFIFIDRGSI